jgi:hypothetical protein
MLSMSPGFSRVLTRKEWMQTMQNEQLSKPEMPAADTRKTYCKPQLVEYGQVQELTQSGTPSILGETGPYAPVSG